MYSTYLFAFDAFDPMSDEAPAYSSETLRDIVGRARAVLKGRTSRQLKDGLQRLDWMLAETCNQFQQDELIKAPHLEAHEPSAETLLTRSMEMYDIEAQSALPDAIWAEYFAILALAHIGEIATARRGPIFGSTLGAREKEWWFVESTHAHAIQAMEAVCCAEHLVTQAVVQVAKQEKISLQARQAAIKRHADITRLKQEFFDYYHAGTFSSYVAAAHSFYDGLPRDRQKLLAPTNAVRTLSEALSKHERPMQALG